MTGLLLIFPPPPPSSLSSSSRTWQQVSAKDRKELNSDSKDDGEFFMSYEDFIKNFSDFEILSVSVDELYENESGKCIHNNAFRNEMGSLSLPYI